MSYPDLNDRIALLMTLVKPGGRPHVRLKPGCVVTTVSWKHWPCLFPSTVPASKHHREIALTDWQHDDRRRVDRRPSCAGLFHSDGCRVRQLGPQAGGR